jgi:itaconyl-CoA hydratase/mesaconyl-C4 CoA hydratase
MSNFSYAPWLGRQEDVHDDLSMALVKRIAATLSEPAPAIGEPLPPLWQWAFFQAAVDEAGLGEDGHPARGGFLPPGDKRNRMWAGGRIEFYEPLRAGIAAMRRSTIQQIEEKAGRTGLLLFVTICHEYLQEGRLAIREEQDIVYREPSPPKAGGTDPMPVGDWSEPVLPTATLLFRYSAVTFNSHRIHHDWPYATGTEGYAGLVIHGPLIATLTLRAFCRANPASSLRRFAYRGVRPLMSPQPFEVGGRISATGEAELWAGNEAGPAQRAEVHFD